ncbi:unnamed protein product [Chondrus crispus]|uniref:Pre-mRNA-splicing factor SLU7 n=1 Tax=Chondrus crispus TaxID=2769 RepID=R7QEQ7_CHOCR|nr:unnamed protein product [Chondrus crispus]CDF35941.1 unnamed protein product [Chondrus crispus]|eukprot:XP_005715760.1 unnamed protein product [Chondrus crispus]
MASSSGAFKSREAWKAAKELEEARKAGTAPPAIDDDGKIINPHIPEYIAQAPWYIDQETPSLKHQRNQKALKRNFDPLGKWLPRGETVGPAATKYRKGACENCGAMTHKKKNCLERPRRRGAKLTGRNIRPDEAIASVNLDFAGKRDRWNGYDESTEYDKVLERYEKIEAERRALKVQKLDAELRNRSKKQRPGKGNSDELSDGDDSDDSDSDMEKDGAVEQDAGQGSKMVVRNLRIREDTAKYLINLNTDSAYYDPKSRAMRADPNPDINSDDKDYAGDNFVRYSGDVTKLAQMESHTLKAAEAGRNLPHLQAEPSRAEALFKDFEAKKKGLDKRRQDEIREKYGGQEYAKLDPGIEGVQQTEAYVEFSSDGRALKGAREIIPVSKYPEDILEKNHNAIWGSFYKDGNWGYGCCHSTQRNCYCTGDAGKQAALATEADMAKRTEAAIAKRNPEPLTKQWEKLERERQENALPEEEALEKEKEHQNEVAKQIRKQAHEERMMAELDTARGKHSRIGADDPGGMSKAAKEAYQLRKQMRDDPMASYIPEKGT